MVSSGIVAAYSGTSLTTTAQIQPFIVAQASNDTTSLANLGGGLINSIGGKVSTTTINTTPAFTCGTSTVTGRSPDATIYQTVMGADGKCWLKSNLGTANVATSSADSTAYGWLYQWGRLTDGHQIRTSAVLSTQSTGDIPGHADFIISV